MNEKVQDLKHKMTDYMNFSRVLLFVSACLSMGAIVPLQGRSGFDQILLSVAGVVFLVAAGFFYRQFGRIKQLVKQEQM